MSQPGAPGGHGLKTADDHGHFPEEEILKDLGSRAYKLKPHEKESINEVEQALRSGQTVDKDTLHHYQHFLEHLTFELKEILQEEHGDHIHNMQLEKDLRKVAQLMQEISAVLDRN